MKGRLFSEFSHVFVKTRGKDGENTEKTRRKHGEKRGEKWKDEILQIGIVFSFTCLGVRFGVSSTVGTVMILIIDHEFRTFVAKA